MKRNLPIFLLLLLLVVFGYGAASAQTFDSTNDDSSDVDDTAPVQRVARLSFIQGDVSFLRAGVTEWAPAVENLPLLSGDQIYTERGARAEIQLGRGEFIRISENTELTISELSAAAAQFEITEGTAIIQIERLSSAFGRFEVDTPNSAIVLRQDGLYRIDVRGERDSELIVRRGQADVSTDEGSFRVREGNRLFVDTSVGGRLELAADTMRDDWDRWSYDRDSTIDRVSASAAPDDVINYETTYSDFYGASDLSSYGTWTSYPSYGQCWIPRVAADWAPYRSGQWLWIPSAGWTWLASEPWGWAPYHYGRWALLPGLGWAWAPGFGSRYGGYGYRDYHWRPALVYFFNCSTSRGNYVGWYPLAPGERWHRFDRWRSPGYGWRDGRLAITPYRHGMTILPYEGFIRRDHTFRPSAPTRELADSISKSARRGLPDMKPAPVAAAPVLADGDRRKFRRIAAPPADVDRRGVVTRNPNADSTSLLGGHRERRTISDNRAPALVDQQNGQADQDRHQEKEQRRQQQRQERKQQQQQGGADSGGERHSQRIRVPLPSSSESLNIDGGGRERKSSREADRSSSSDDEWQRHREERVRSRDTGGAVSGGQQNDQGRQEQRQEKEQRREQQRQERHQEQQRQQQQQPEHHHQERQQQAQQPEHHHHQEQQQQQQQQQEQRRKHQ